MVVPRSIGLLPNSVLGTASPPPQQARYPKVTFPRLIADKTGRPEGYSAERIMVARHPWQAMLKLEHGGPT